MELVSSNCTYCAREQLTNYYELKELALFDLNRTGEAWTTR